LKRYPVKACILGKPLSGKTTLARELAKKYKMEIISSEGLLEYAASIANLEERLSLKGEKSEEDNFYQEEISPEMRRFVQLANHALKAGKQVEDKILVGLIVEKIKEVEKKLKDSASNSDYEQTEVIGGWILDGFPR
jgi:adenylate kinase family enzyme